MKVGRTTTVLLLMINVRLSVRQLMWSRVEIDVKKLGFESPNKQKVQFCLPKLLDFVLSTAFYNWCTNNEVQLLPLCHPKLVFM